MTREEQARLRQAQLQVMAAALSLVAMLWALTPEWQQRMLLVRTLTGLRRALHVCARRVGRAAMRAELRAGHADYAVPYLLASWRDELDVWIARMRMVD